MRGGRAPAQITAGAVRHTASLTVPRVLRMEVGELRVISREQLQGACLQFPASEQSFVLTVLNPALEESAGTDALLAVPDVDRERRPPRCGADGRGHRGHAAHSGRSRHAV